MNIYFKKSKEIVKSVIILILLLVFAGQSFSNTIDSLKNQLSHAKNDTNKVNLLNRLAFSTMVSDFDKSIEYANIASRLSDSLNFKRGKALALKYMGTGKWNQGNYAEAKDMFYQSLKIYESLNDIDGLSRLWNNIGLINITQDEYLTASDNFNKSIELSKKINNNFMLGTAKLNLGINHHYLKNYDSSNYYLKKSIIYAKKINDSNLIATDLSFIGINETLLRNFDSAKSCLDRALEIFVSLNNIREQVRTKIAIAKYYSATGDFSGSINIAKDALQHAKKLNSKFNIFEASFHLSETYKKLKDYKKAYKFLALSKKYGDTLHSEESKRNIANLTAEYNYEKKLRKIEIEKEREKQHIDRELRQRNYIILIISISLFLTIIFSIILYRINLSRKLKNKILVNQNIEIEKNHKMLEEMNNDLNLLNATKDKFFSIIAHDLRNPIGGLNSITQLMSSEFKDMNDDEKLEFIELMNESTTHVSSLLENLLTWSRSQRNTIDFNPVPANLKQVVEPTIQGVKLSAANKNIDLSYDLDDKYEVFADANMLTTIVRNILNNAVKFTPMNGSIKVEATENGNNIDISIKDSGVGIPEDKIDILFDIGTNVTTPGTENEKGTGLGLIICKEFAEKNGGDIEVKSEKGNGSEFIISIPKSDK